MVRAGELAQHGVSRGMLHHLYRKGLLERAARGLYRLPDRIPEESSLAQAARLVPKGVICLLSALRFHDVGAQQPHQVWIALPPKAWNPRVSAPALRIVRFSGPALSEGVEEHQMSGVTIRVYCVAKTVADTFKYRNKIGLDVALEALRDVLARRKATRDQIWHFASICRVQRVIRPYIEALT